MTLHDLPETDRYSKKEQEGIFTPPELLEWRTFKKESFANIYDINEQPKLNFLENNASIPYEDTQVPSLSSSNVALNFAFHTAAEEKHKKTG